MYAIRSYYANANDRSGTFTAFVPDVEIFGEYQWKDSIIESMLWNYAYLNTGLTLAFNDKKFHSQNGLLDLLNDEITEEIQYPIIHLRNNFV